MCPEQPTDPTDGTTPVPGASGHPSVRAGNSAAPVGRCRPAAGRAELVEEARSGCGGYIGHKIHLHADAETDEEILERFEGALSKIRSHHPVPAGAIVVVTHGGVMRAFLRKHFGPSVLSGHERASNASITRLLYDPADPNAAPRLLELASTSHLSREEERQTPTRIE